MYFKKYTKIIAISMCNITKRNQKMLKNKEKKG